jgi:hypothetical protein
MSRGSKYFLLALGGGVFAWVLGVMLIGYADVRYFTSSGVVDMLDPAAISAALSDPSFTATVSWGRLSLTGVHWTFSFPLLLATATFIGVLLIAKIRQARAHHDR